MEKRLTSFICVFALSFSLSVSAFAVDDNNYYSLPPVGASESSVAMDWPVMPASDAQLATIIDILGNISKQITTVQSNQSVLGKMISNLTTIVTNNGNTLFDILSSMGVYQSLLEAISNKVATEATLSKVATENTLNYLTRIFCPSSSGDTDSSLFDQIWVNSAGYQWDKATFGHLFSLMFANLTADLPFSGSGSPRTLYGYVSDLANTLATEDDRQLAQNYKDNRDQAEKDFLNGSSGKTSLGKGDFSNASQVGGALNDTFNMGGAAKVSDFLSGFGSAGSESQAWFSQTTSNNLNAVEAGDGTSGVSTFADDGQIMVDIDPDPYNMADIFSRYDWLEGVNMDD